MAMTGRKKAFWRSAARTGFVLALSASALAGCAAIDRTTTGSVRSAGAAATFDRMTDAQIAEVANRLGAHYARNPKDKGVALNYAGALARLGRNDQALAVMRALVIVYPKDQAVLAAYGKALAANGDLETALDAVRRAQNPAYPDWRLLSAEGSILDQMGQKDEARALYRQALQIKPGEASVLSNMGMSYMLSGDLKSAETWLQQAVAAPGADSRVRQNLALAVGLQGRFQEAEAIAARELSPQQAKANVDYLRSMLAQQNSWAMLKDKPKG